MKFPNLVSEAKPLVVPQIVFKQHLGANVLGSLLPLEVVKPIFINETTRNFIGRVW